MEAAFDRREFFGVSAKTTAALAAAAAVGETFVLAGCNVLSELETWVPIGLSAFDTLVSYINPVAGGAISVIINTVNGLWEALTVAIANYQHTTDPTTTLLDKIIAAMDALSGGLNTILNSLPPGISAAVLEAIKFGFNLLLSTLKSIQASLPTTGNVVSAKLTLKSVSTNGVSSAVSTKDFITRFNTSVCVAAGHPARLK